MNLSFREWLELDEGSRWRQPAELQAMMHRIDPTRFSHNGPSPDVTRGTALNAAAAELGKDLPRLNQRLSNLNWTGGDADTATAFSRGEQPSYIYRGHDSPNPYVSTFAKTHATPWTSVAAKYGLGFGDYKIGSRFAPQPDQLYYPDYHAHPAHVQTGRSPSSGVDQYTGYETEISPERHGGGEPVLLKPSGAAAVSQQDLQRIYRPLTTPLRNMRRKRDWWPKRPTSTTKSRSLPPDKLRDIGFED